jgi:hypothetical protein
MAVLRKGAGCLEDRLRTWDGRHKDVHGKGQGSCTDSAPEARTSVGSPRSPHSRTASAEGHPERILEGCRTSLINPIEPACFDGTKDACRTRKGCAKDPPGFRLRMHSGGHPLHILDESFLATQNTFLVASRVHPYQHSLTDPC